MAAINFLGIGLWIIVLGFMLFTFHNIRVRRLKRIIAGQKGFNGASFLLSGCFVVITVLGLWFAAYATFFRNVSMHNKNEVRVSYQYEPLVMSSIKGKFYDVKVVNGNGKEPIQYYTYWVKGARYQNNSRHATVSAGPHAINLDAAKYPWQRQKLAQYDQKTEQSYVATMKATYKSTIMNGLGLRAGRQATSFSIIRVQNSSVIYITPAK
ncbi:LVIS_2131 family protein [Loigolactobacillus bifermentans]|uniref:Uncharacterized protein n=1 Tax=Loigolactobacillus bifermentans DSM 20003 TaxID=1423726 RepID=A0A0R1H0P8_9LACO|nr:LVIS_2131 family protein [Loigolactobacillus bifermentans]KRK40166.1 hypothetical protein FC07_GL001368 [Loigolactobacillus bifermentans DSM 20003]QGG60911.1 hypothetical protein LB003_10785 [Loigolactobacillus bifermentans]